MQDQINFKDWKTVVLTPWFWCLPHTMSLLWKHLQESMNIIYAPTHRINTVSIKVSAKELEEKLSIFSWYLHFEDISLVWHSMGGLIVVETLKNMVSERVQNIITISSPFQGTPMANFCSPFLKACEEINTPWWFHKDTVIWHQLNWKLIANVSEKDFIVPAWCQIPNKTIAKWKTKVIRHKEFDHKSGLIGDTCKTISNIIQKYCV